MSLAKRSKGTQLQYGDGGAPETFTAVAEVLNVSGPTSSREEIDVTHLDSPSDYREKLQSFIDAGEISFQVNFIPGDPSQDPTTGLISFFADGLNRNWKLVFPTTTITTMAFAAAVKSFQPNAQVGSQLTASVTLGLSGPVTWS